MDRLGMKKEELMRKLQKKMDQIDNDIEECNKNIREEEARKKEAFEDGDLRENAAYQTAKENLAKLQVQYAKLHRTKEEWNEFKDIKSSSAYVGVGSMVHVRIDDGAQQQILDILLVPSALAQTDIGAIPIDAPIAKALQGAVLNVAKPYRTVRGTLTATPLEIC